MTSESGIKASSTIERILTLQERDRRITRLKQESEDIPARKAHIEASIETEKSAVSTAHEELKKLQSAAKQIELDIETCQERITKLRTQQFQVKNNDEYRTLEHEIEGAQKQIDGLENQELELMEQMESTRAFVAEKESELKRGEDHVQAEFDALEKRIGHIDSEIGELTAEREALAADTDSEWLARYERIIAHTRNYALVAVENNACGGCHMKLPPQVVHDARKGMAIVSCPFCSRMLYCPS